MSGMTAKASALKAGYSEKTALSCKLDKGIDLKTQLEIAGFTNQTIANKVYERFDSDEGMIGHKYLETALKLLGAQGFAQDKQLMNVDKVQINVYLPTNEINSITPQ